MRLLQPKGLQIPICPSCESQVSIKLTGDLDGVDADTFIDFLGNISVAIHQINEDIQSNKSLTITIKNIKPGSFDIFLTIKETFIDALMFHRDPLAAASDIFTILCGIIMIRQFLNGKEPKSTERSDQKTVIVNGDGNTFTIDNRTFNVFISDQVVDAAVGKSFDALNEDSAIEAMEIYDGNNKRLCSIPRDKFKEMSLPSVLSGKDTRIKSEEAKLTVFKVVFDKGFKWQFYYQGNRISAEIRDESFFKVIDEGEKFSKGDTLIVDLEITQVFDDTIEAYVNKEFNVVKIKQHIPRGRQGNLL